MNTAPDPAISYPIGKYDWEYKPTDEEVKSAITTLRNLPGELRKAVQNLTEEQLNTTYREGGWTLRQVVHHLADSHANAFIRAKLALTEDNPKVKTYHENKWAELPDAKGEIEPSLKMIDGMHSRFADMLASLDTGRLTHTYYHPEKQKSYDMRQLANMYAWHSRHHLAHITELKKRKGWQ
jgi:hypothetical protein